MLLGACRATRTKAEELKWVLCLETSCAVQRDDSELVLKGNVAGHETVDIMLR